MSGILYFVFLLLVCGGAAYGSHKFCSTYLGFYHGDDRKAQTGITFVVFIIGAIIFYTAIFVRIAISSALKEQSENAVKAANGIILVILIVVALGILGYVLYIRYAAEVEKNRPSAVYDQNVPAGDSE